MEDGLVLLVPDRAHVLHAAHVMHAVHALPPAGVSWTWATPIIASRVTSAASSSSVSFSLPEGLSGSTRYRSSAVLSQTRTSIESGRSRPNSCSTPRGSITARERYGADLYQTGGSPSTAQG